ncbi:MAG: CaiB/BaiF CoA-transferase family protein [Myxococcota bacterium]
MILSGIRIVDFTRLLPGPYATRVLAELGAEVIKVEATPGGDYARWWPPLSGDPPISTAFAELNRGKKSVALDFRDPASQVALQKLVRSADVLIDGFRPGTLAKMGLDPAALMQELPSLIYCSLTGFGLDGPDVDRAGHDIGYLARAGALGIVGSAEAPMTMGIQVADVAGSWVAISGILAALLRRQASGQGGVVDVAMMEASLGFASLAYGAFRGGAPPVRGQELLDGSRPCYRVYRTKDGRFLAVGALEPKFWAMFVEAIGLPELSASGLDHGETGRAVIERVQARLLERSQAEWAELFRRVDCCVEPVLDIAESVEDPQLVARQAFASGYSASPIRVRSTLSGAVQRVVLGEAPSLGQHTEEVLVGLGISAPSRS